ncbi:hypothetical protein Lal_00023038 [Lupinus albus]|nr:hypothetical protein Lal_00023038 [Lupinus albus]
MEIGGDGGAAVENAERREEWKLDVKGFQLTRQTQEDNKKNKNYSSPFRLRKNSETFFLFFV